MGVVLAVVLGEHNEGSPEVGLECGREDVAAPYARQGAAHLLELHGAVARACCAHAETTVGGAVVEEGTEDVVIEGGRVRETKGVVDVLAGSEQGGEVFWGTVGVEGAEPLCDDEQYVVGDGEGIAEGGEDRHGGRMCRCGMVGGGLMKREGASVGRRSERRGEDERERSGD